jgi:3-hydroxyacyl-[acyl-carrier protein] dehydratase/trans-2-decenoyl-[acyl-carrier protein] isomerase
MKYAEFLEKTSFSKQELIGLAYGTTVDDPPPDFFRMPAPPMLMLDRILEISRDPKNRFIVGEQDIRLDLWFFQCHFTKDPVQPGCLGIDAVWQLMGLYCASLGSLGLCRALGCKEVSFFGQIRPHNRVVRYEVEIQRCQLSPLLKTAVAIASAKVFVDGEHVYDISHAKGGLYRGIQYSNYPFLGPNSVGGPAQQAPACRLAPL